MCYLAFIHNFYAFDSRELQSSLEKHFKIVNDYNGGICKRQGYGGKDIQNEYTA